MTNTSITNSGAKTDVPPRTKTRVIVVARDDDDDDDDDDEIPECDRLDNISSYEQEELLRSTAVLLEKLSEEARLEAKEAACDRDKVDVDEEPTSGRADELIARNNETQPLPHEAEAEEEEEDEDEVEAEEEEEDEEAEANEETMPPARKVTSSSSQPISSPSSLPPLSRSSLSQPKSSTPKSTSSQPKSPEVVLTPPPPVSRKPQLPSKPSKPSMSITSPSSSHQQQQQQTPKSHKHQKQIAQKSLAATKLPSKFDGLLAFKAQVQNASKLSSGKTELCGAICVPYVVGNGTLVHNPMTGSLVSWHHEDVNLRQNVYGHHTNNKQSGAYDQLSALSGTPRKKSKKDDNQSSRQPESTSGGGIKVNYANDNFINHSSTLSWLVLNPQTKNPQLQLFEGCELWQFMYVFAPMMIPPSTMYIGLLKEAVNECGDDNGKNDARQRRAQLGIPNQFQKLVYEHQLQEIEALAGSILFNRIPFTTNIASQQCMFLKSNISILGSFAGSGKTRVAILSYMIANMSMHLKRIIEAMDQASSNTSPQIESKIATIKNSYPNDALQEFEAQMVCDCEPDHSDDNNVEDVIYYDDNDQSGRKISFGRDNLIQAMLIVCSESLTPHWRTQIMELNSSDSPTSKPQFFETPDGAQSFKVTSDEDDDDEEEEEEEEEEDEEEEEEEEEEDEDEEEEEVAHGSRSSSSTKYKSHSKLPAKPVTKKKNEPPPSASEDASSKLLSDEYIQTAFAVVISITSTTIRRLFPDIDMLAKGGVRRMVEKRKLAFDVIKTIDGIFTKKSRKIDGEWAKSGLNEVAHKLRNLKDSEHDNPQMLKSLERLYGIISKHKTNFMNPRFVIMSAEALTLYHQCMVTLGKTSTHRFQHVLIDEVCDLPLPTIPTFEHLTLVSSTALTKLKPDAMNTLIERAMSSKPSQPQDRQRLIGLCKVPILLKGGESSMVSERIESPHLKLPKGILTASISRADLNAGPTPNLNSALHPYLQTFRSIALPAIMSDPDYIRDSIRMNEVHVYVHDVHRIDSAQYHFFNDRVMKGAFAGPMGKSAERRCVAILRANATWSPFNVETMMNIFKEMLKQLSKQEKLSQTTRRTSATAAKSRNSQRSVFDDDNDDLESILSDDDDFTALMPSREFDDPELKRQESEEEGDDVGEEEDVDDDNESVDSSILLSFCSESEKDEDKVVHEDKVNDDDDDPQEDEEAEKEEEEEGDAEKEEVLVPTRKRGRPPKSQNVVVVAAVKDQANVTKQGRGRPRKYLRIEDVSENMDDDDDEMGGGANTSSAPDLPDTPTTVKRGRGRPPKVRVTSTPVDSESELEEAAEEPTPIKRGRGRPPKVRVTSTPGDSESELEEAAEEPTPIKRGRGRPPKAKVQVTASSSSSSRGADNAATPNNKKKVKKMTMKSKAILKDHRSKQRETRQSNARIMAKMRESRRDNARMLKIKNARLDFAKFLLKNDESIIIPFSLVGIMSRKKKELQSELDERPEMTLEKLQSWGFAKYVRALHLITRLRLRRGDGDRDDAATPESNPSNLVKEFMFGCCTQCNRPCIKESVQVPVAALQKYTIVDGGHVNIVASDPTELVGEYDANDNEDGDDLTPEEDKQLRDLSMNSCKLTNEEKILRRKRALVQRNAPIPKDLISQYGPHYARLPWFTCTTCRVVQCGQCSLTLEDQNNVCGLCFKRMRSVGLGYKNDARIYKNALKIVECMNQQMMARTSQKNAQPKNKKRKNMDDDSDSEDEVDHKKNLGNKIGQDSKFLFPSSRYDVREDSTYRMCVKMRHSTYFTNRNHDDVPKYALRLNPFESTIFVIRAIVANNPRPAGQKPISIVTCLPNAAAINSAISALCPWGTHEFTCFKTERPPQRGRAKFEHVSKFVRMANDNQIQPCLVLFLDTSNTGAWVGLDLNMSTDFILPVYVSETSSHQFINRVLRQPRDKNLRVHRIHATEVEL